MKTLIETNYDFPHQTGVYHGKVRDVYFIGEKLLVMIASDRISAFDVILPKGIPYKGQVLNQIAEYFLDATADIIPNWKISVPDPMATLGHLCKPLKVEVIVRGYLAGSAWREYKEGKREFGGLVLPDGYKENQRLPYPVVTPTTKEDSGHDQNITREQIVAQGIVEKDIYEKVHQTALRLFERGQEMAEERGLILVDTKYEFGLLDGKLMLIDEIHTPDSSRYFYADGYQERFDKGEKQQQLSKEFVRQWLIDHDFMGLEGQKVPEMTDQFCEDVSRRYIELYEKVTGKKFIPAEEGEDISKRIFCNVSSEIEKLEK